MLLDVTGAQMMANGQRIAFGDLVVEAVPMYNADPDPQSGSIMHPKGRGNGYVITVGTRRVYVGGDTACTPEMMALKNIDIAFVPMNLPYTMSPLDAAACVKAMKPKVVYPYHDWQSDPAAFESALRGSGIEVRIRDRDRPRAGGTPEAGPVAGARNPAECEFRWAAAFSLREPTDS